MVRLEILHEADRLFGVGSENRDEVPGGETDPDHGRSNETDARPAPDVDTREVGASDRRPGEDRGKPDEERQTKQCGCERTEEAVLVDVRPGKRQEASQQHRL